MAQLSDCGAFLRHIAPGRKKAWVVYAKPTFSGPEAVLAYLACYTHRVAISNCRLIAFDEAGVTFRYQTRLFVPTDGGAVVLARLSA